MRQLRLHTWGNRQVRRACSTATLSVVTKMAASARQSCTARARELSPLADRHSGLALTPGHPWLGGVARAAFRQLAAWAPHRQREAERPRERVQQRRDDRKRDVGAQDAERGDGGEEAEERLLAHRQPRVQDDRRQEEFARKSARASPPCCLTPCCSLPADFLGTLCVQRTSASRMAPEEGQTLLVAAGQHVKLPVAP